MNYSVINLPKSEIEIEITLLVAEFEPYVKRAAVSISERVEIEGFRTGKAPYEVVKSKVGEQAIYEEAAELAVRKTYPETVRETMDKRQEAGEDFTPIGKPEITITKLAPGNELMYKVRIALLPHVSLPDYKTIAKKARGKRQEATVSDEETDKAVQWLRESRATLVTVSRKAEKGDRVEVDFEIRHHGVKVEGGESRNHPLVLGEGKFLPGFEDNLAGMAPGERKEFALAAPHDWSDRTWAGKTLDVSAQMRLVQERTVPELTDEFAHGLGDFASVDALKKSVREGLLAEKREKETQRIRGLMMEEIAGQARMEIPEVLTAGETEKMLSELKSGIEEMGMKWEDYLTHIKKTPEELRGEWRQEAERRTRIALVLREIARQEHIEPAEEEITARANRSLAQYGSPDGAQKQVDAQGLKEYARGILKNEKVFELLEAA